MNQLAQCLRDKQPCWLVIYPPPYTKFKLEEIRKAVRDVQDSGGFVDRRESRITKLADIMLKREFRDFRCVVGTEQPRVQFGEVRTRII